MAYSPWGKIQNVEKIQRGLMWVSTASHGGFIISKNFAEKTLSYAARSRAILYNNAYYCFEEDVACFMVLFELSTARKNETIEYITKTLSRWFPNYLMERGIEPDPEMYSHWLKDKEDADRRTAKDPNFTVVALSVNDSVTKVWTADGKEYLVKAESYRKCLEIGCHNLSEMVLA